MDLARAPRRAARKKGSGYENVMSGFKDGGGVIVPGYLQFTD
jgi:hypothetical protein